MPDLVLTIGAKYSALVYERYLMSLRRTGFAGDIAVLLRDVDLTAEVQTVLQRYQAQAVTYGASRFIEVSLRFPLFLQVLQQYKQRASTGYVLHTDLRDVIFQNDPFENVSAKKADLSFALEEGLIDQCRFNTEWIRSGFGQEVFNQLAFNKISCAGTTLGSFEAMHYYFNRMSELIFSKADPNNLSSDTINDQGVHNYLLWLEGFGKFSTQKLDNSTGLFLSVGLMQEVSINQLGQISSPGVESASVVHQLDRLPPAAIADIQDKVPFRLDDLLRASVEREVLFGVERPIRANFV